MKSIILLFAACLSLGYLAYAQNPPVNGEIIADTNNLTILKVWGTSEERGYAYGYLLNEAIKDVSYGVIRPWLGFNFYPVARQMVMDGEVILIDSLFRNEAMVVVNGMADAGVDTTDFNHIDLLVTNFAFTLSSFSGKSGFGCSTFLNWGNATAGTDLDGKSVISRHYDSPYYLPVYMNNVVITIFIPTEENTQPWMNAEIAGAIVPSCAGINQAGISIFQNSMSGAGNPQPGVGYIPFELVSKIVLESSDFNGDGVNNTQDVRDALSSNPQGYAGGWIISTLARWNPNSDSLTALIAEIAPDEPMLTYRTNAHEDLIPDDNLYATNSPIKRNNANNYCTRYMNMVNHMGDGTGIGTQENWDLMADYSHPVSAYNYIFCQHIPDPNIFRISNYRNNTNAYLLEPLVIDLGELFNRPPTFVSKPDTIGVTGSEFLYEISVFDPDLFDTIGIWAEQMPAWLNLVDFGDGSAQLSGTPEQSGIYQVLLKTCDSYGAEDVQEFEIHIGTVSVYEIFDSFSKIYPNPVSGMLTIELDLPNTPINSIQIFNAMGAKVAELHHSQLPAGQQQYRWDAGDLPKGLYFCRVQAGNETFIQKIIKVQ